MPESLRPEEIRKHLASGRLGKTIHYFAELDSTNRAAYKLAGEGAAEGEVVLAEAQTRGKGRLGRSWFSPPGLNLYLSVILRPKLSPSDAPQLTLVAAVALADTVRRFLGRAPAIKWPNDILVGGKKLAGILTESSVDSQRLHFVVVGVGVNLNMPASMLPEDIRGLATSLLILTNQMADRTSFAKELIHSLDRCYGELEQSGFPPMAARWESFFELKGRKVKVEMGDRVVLGIARGIDRDGALILEKQGGATERIIAGDVTAAEA
ncbi:MAG TPA: biotin--[acetyl-CoA-carboxylase] ligase [Candidatus Binatia bacterium]|jgi:BirA family biotin operon repressor/biotin-[acetyl-CoA-carboxylase] ligase